MVVTVPFGMQQTSGLRKARHDDLVVQLQVEIGVAVVAHADVACGASTAPALEVPSTTWVGGSGNAAHRHQLQHIQTGMENRPAGEWRTP